MHCIGLGNGTYFVYDPEIEYFSESWDDVTELSDLDAATGAFRTQLNALGNAALTLEDWERLGNVSETGLQFGLIAILVIQGITFVVVLPLALYNDYKQTRRKDSEFAFNVDNTFLKKQCGTVVLELSALRASLAAEPRQEYAFSADDVVNGNNNDDAKGQRAYKKKAAAIDKRGQRLVIHSRVVNNRTLLSLQVTKMPTINPVVGVLFEVTQRMHTHSLAHTHTHTHTDEYARGLRSLE